MSKTKVYAVDDLFFTSWKDLDDITHARVFTLQQALTAMDKSNPQYGYALIASLRLLRKRPLLVDKINVPQAVDIYNDLKFLREPWYYFPEIPNDLTAVKPDDHMARSSFDQFIYADNEFSTYLINEDKKHLRRLAVTIYAPRGEEIFDAQTVETREASLQNIDEDLLMQMFFTFMQVRNFVMKRYKRLLPKAAASDDEDRKPSPTGAMWHEIKHQVVRTNVFGTFKETGQSRMYDVLDHLEILCKEQEEKKK